MNASDPCVIIIDERALISTVLKQLCEAIRPGLKVYHLTEVCGKLARQEKVAAVLFDLSKADEVMKAIATQLPGQEPVTIGCGPAPGVACASVDYIIDLYETPQKIISVLKEALLGSNVLSSGQINIANGQGSSREAAIKKQRLPEFTHRTLTPRQVEILEYAALGLSAPEIAEVLNVSVNTVRGYVQEIFTRLNVRNIAHAVSCYLKSQTLIDFEDHSDHSE